MVTQRCESTYVIGVNESGKLHIRTTVQHGNLYRLQSPQRHDLSATQYVAQDGSQAVVLV